MMERALKERIIGAVILVLVVVLVVPVFLDGPPPDEEIVSRSVVLPGQTEQERQTVVLERDREEPVPAASNGTADTADPAPIETHREPARPPPTTAKQASAASAEVPAPVTAKPPTEESSATGMWAVQLGSFGNQENAERLAAELRSQGFAAFLSKLKTPSGELHRVRVGPQKDRPSAEAMAARLEKAGHEGKVLPHP